MTQKLGTTLIAAWYALGGLAMLLLAAGTGLITRTLDLPPAITAIGAGFFGIIALIAFAIAYGIYTLESWGWYTAMILNGISITLSLIQVNILGVIIPGIIVWYLWTNQKDYKVSVSL